MDNEQSRQMKQIESVLETRPTVSVPDDFAARVMARVPAQENRRRLVMITSLPKQTRFRNGAMIGAMVLLMAGMITLAPLSRGSYVWLSLEGLLLTQLCVLVVLFGLQFREDR